MWNLGAARHGIVTSPQTLCSKNIICTMQVELPYMEDSAKQKFVDIRKLYNG